MSLSAPGCSIQVCPNGCVTLRFAMTSVHLDAEQFRRFASTVADALAYVESQIPRPPDAAKARLN